MELLAVLVTFFMCSCQYIFYQMHYTIIYYNILVDFLSRNCIIHIFNCRYIRVLTGDIIPLNRVRLKIIRRRTKATWETVQQIWDIIRGKTNTCIHLKLLSQLLSVLSSLRCVICSKFLLFFLIFCCLRNFYDAQMLSGTSALNLVIPATYLNHLQVILSYMKVKVIQMNLVSSLHLTGFLQLLSTMIASYCCFYFYILVHKT